MLSQHAPFSPSLSSNEAKFYVITLKKHNNGYFAYIIESTLTTLFEPNDYIGYNIVGDNNEIVIFCGDVKIPESSGDNSPLTFEIYHGIPFRYEPKEWRYYIVNDLYARLIEGVGWLWNFPTEYENTSKDIIRDIQLMPSEEGRIIGQGCEERA